MAEPQVNEEMMDEQYEDNEVVEGQDVQVSAGEPNDDPLEDQENDSQERVDWKARAIEAETRAKEYQRWLEQQQGNAQAAQQQQNEPSRLEQLQREVKELESTVPPVDPQNPETFWENQKAKDQLNQKRFELQEARIEQQQQSQLKMQAQTAVQTYKSRFRGDPRFKAIESQFDSAVTQLAPHLQTNPAMLDLLRKNAIFDYMEKNPDATQTQGQSQSQKKPPQAPSGAYNQQAPAKQKGMKFKSEQDATVASFYRMTPEEFYNEPPSPHTEGNGIQIYDIPESPRRFGRG